MERMNVEGMVRQLYIHYGVNVSSSQFWEPGAWQQSVYVEGLDEVERLELGRHTECRMINAST